MSEKMTRADAVEILMSIAGMAGAQSNNVEQDMKVFMDGADAALRILGVEEWELRAGKINLASTLVDVMIERGIPVPGVTEGVQRPPPSS
jgi:hypothetical protein